MEKTEIVKQKRRIARFGAVGIFNTLFDFGILNLLVFTFGVSKFGANVVSVSLAMIVSYLLNHSFVFKNDDDRSLKKFALFVCITAVGIYILQNSVIFFLAHIFVWPAATAHQILEWIAPNFFSEDFITLNFAKAVATACSMTWNYILYSRYLFQKEN